MLNRGRFGRECKHGNGHGCGDNCNKGGGDIAEKVNGNIENSRTHTGNNFEPSLPLLPTLFLILLLLVLLPLLGACSLATKQPGTQVERLSLLRSMTYSQRHLVELALGSPPRTSETNQARETLLLAAHCDLIYRDVVHAANPAALCNPVIRQQSPFCMAQFHRCIGSCENFKRDCKPCEQRAAACLLPSKSG